MGVAMRKDLVVVKGREIWPFVSVSSAELDHITYLECTLQPLHYTNSMSPSGFVVPRFTSSPLAFSKSSTVRSFPSSVLSLNQPRWSAIKCRFLHDGHWMSTMPL